MSRTKVAPRRLKTKPVTFACEVTLCSTPQEIVEKILTPENWTDFNGYLVLPGIKSAEFESRTPDVIGTRIRVTNTDGSTHLEQIVAYEPDRKLVMELKEFSRPLSSLATAFEETWDFRREHDATHVTRSFQLTAKSPLKRPLLTVISVLLKRAIARHLGQMREAE